MNQDPVSFWGGYVTGWLGLDADDAAIQRWVEKKTRTAKQVGSSKVKDARTNTERKYKLAYFLQDQEY